MQFEQKLTAEASKQKAQNSFDQLIVTEITEAMELYPAEQYHQNFYNQNQTYGYCDVIISPKIKKFRDDFRTLLK